MIITSPGKVTDRITMLGCRESCVYVVDGGKECALLGGGMSYIIPDILTGLENFGIDPKKLTRLIIHHTHFDHVGIAPYFKKHFPWIRVMASIRGRAQLSRPEVTKNIMELNRMILAEHGLRDKGAEWGLDGSRIEVDRTVEDGDRIPLGDISLDFLEVPGHSSCSLAVYVPEEKALCASDSGGIPHGDQVFTAANSNFDLYQAGLAKMAALEVEVYCAEHYGALTEEHGRGFLTKSMETAGEARSLMEESLALTRDPDKTADEFTERLVQETGGYFLPKEIMRMVMGQMARFLAKKQGLIQS